MSGLKIYEAMMAKHSPGSDIGDEHLQDCLTLDAQDTLERGKPVKTASKGGQRPDTEATFGKTYIQKKKIKFKRQNTATETFEIKGQVKKPIPGSQEFSECGEPSTHHIALKARTKARLPALLGSA